MNFVPMTDPRQLKDGDVLHVTAHGSACYRVGDVFEWQRGQLTCRCGSSIDADALARDMESGVQFAVEERTGPW